jgi:hypothetical protein
MSDGRKNNGGNKNAGRKPKAEEEKQRVIYDKVLKRIYNTEDSEESKVLFLIDFASEKEGKKFLAEHVFGKAPQVVDNKVTNVLEEKVGVLFKGGK